MAGKKPTYKVFDPTIDDSIDLAGILASGGLAGQASSVLQQIQTNQGAGVDAMARLVLGALANHGSREEMRSFLFRIWKTTEDQQATGKDKGLDGRLAARYDGEGELLEDTPYYKKLLKFHTLPAAALIGIATALYGMPNFKDFLASVSLSLPVETSDENSTGSNESMATVSEMPEH